MSSLRVGSFAAAVMILAALPAEAPAQETKAPEPARSGPEHAKLGYFVGKWHSTGTLKPGPWGEGGPTSGDDDCTMMSGGFFVVCRSESSSPLGKVSSLFLLGYDSPRELYTWNAFNSRGENESAEGTVSGKVWTYLGGIAAGDQALHTRYTITEKSAVSYGFKAEVSDDETTWTTVMEGHVTKR